MTTASLSKTTFIKFNVSSDFKSLAEKKAKEHGMTLSELGRMLFGSFISGVAKPTIEISPKFLKLADQAKKDYEAGKTKSFTSADDAIKYLESL